MYDDLPEDDDFPVRVHYEWLNNDRSPHHTAAQRRADKLPVGETEVYVFYYDLDAPAHRYYLWRPYHNVTYVEQIG